VVKNNEEYRSVSTEDPHLILLNLIFLHEKLTSIIPKINASLTFQLILCSINILLSAIMSMHAIIQDFVFNKEELRNFGIPNTVILIIVLGVFSIPIYSAASISDQTQKLKFLVNRAMVQTGQKPIKDLLMEFGFQINQSHIPIANIFFNIDWKLLYSVKKSEKNLKFII
jgi:hypothetical protein